jgi:hypothetical protein
VNDRTIKQRGVKNGDFQTVEKVENHEASGDSVISRCFPTFAGWGLEMLRPFPTNFTMANVPIDLALTRLSLYLH